MSSRLQLWLWPKEELVRRASVWAESRGWPPATIASLLKWKQEGLLPRPTVKSLGRGRGSISGWEWPTYRRLLRILTYRQRMRRWRDLRIALWLDGYDVDPHQIRADLADLYKELVLSFNRELRTEYWDATDDALPSRSATRAIVRRFTSQNALEGLVRRLELDTVAELFFQLGLSSLMTGEGQRLAIAFVHQFFVTGPGDIPAAVAAFRATLPEALANALDGAENEFAAHAGLLSHPEGFENPLLQGIEEATDQTLVNLRDVANEANRSWRAGLRLSALMLELRPEVLGTFRLTAPFIARMATTMAHRSPFRNPEARVVILALALASESIRADEGQRLLGGLRALSRFAEWLTRRKELLLEIEALSDHRWSELMEASDFPREARQLLLAAQASDVRPLGRTGNKRVADSRR